MHRSSPPIPAKDIDSYIAMQPKAVAAALEKLRQAIRSVVPPETKETITFNIPAFKLNGTLVSFAAFKDHCGLYVVNPAIMEEFKEELKEYTKGKMAIHFTPGKPLPLPLVKKIVKARVKQNLKA